MAPLLLTSSPSQKMTSFLISFQMEWSWFWSVTELPLASGHLHGIEQNKMDHSVFGRQVSPAIQLTRAVQWWIALRTDNGRQFLVRLTILQFARKVRHANPSTFLMKMNFNVSVIKTEDKFRLGMVLLRGCDVQMLTNAWWASITVMAMLCVPTQTDHLHAIVAMVTQAMELYAKVTMNSLRSMN